MLTTFTTEGLCPIAALVLAVGLAIPLAAAAPG